MPVQNMGVQIDLVCRLTGERWYVCEDDGYFDNLVWMPDIKRTELSFVGSKQPYTALQDTNYTVNEMYSWSVESQRELLFTTYRFPQLDNKQDESDPDTFKVTKVFEDKRGKRYEIVGLIDYEQAGNYYIYIITNKKTV